MSRSEDWDVFGSAMFDYWREPGAQTISLIRDDGYRQPMPVQELFGDLASADKAHQIAIQHCAGAILDVGAGSGRYSLILQSMGFDVTAVDVSPMAARLMRARGVVNVIQGDYTRVLRGAFDTVLFMMSGIGIVQSVSGLTKLFTDYDRFVSPGGRMIFDTWDFSKTDMPVHRLYFKPKVGVDRYPGETTYFFEYGNQKSGAVPWLFIEEGKLKQLAWRYGLAVNTLSAQGPSYLAEVYRP